VHLTVDVGFGDHVEIDQGDPADRRTRQCFGRPGTDAADADDRDMRVLEALQRIRTVERAIPAKAAPGRQVRSLRSRVRLSGKCCRTV
jgi:hypothetical protein